MPSTFGQLQPVSADFWRDTSTARALPDGASDVSKGIVHTGAVHMGNNGANAGTAQGFRHEAITSYRGDGTFANQTILTTIPLDTAIMPVIYVKGYAYESANIVDLAIGLYTYGSPSGSLINTVWTSTGTSAPTLVRAGYLGGLLQIELSWGNADDYFLRYEISAFCDGNASHKAEWFQGWTVAQAVFGAVTNIVTIPQKAPTAQDFFRSDPAGLLPDGVADTTEAIVRKGPTKLQSATGTANDSSLILDNVRGITNGYSAGSTALGNQITGIGVDNIGNVKLSNSLVYADSRTTNTFPQDYAAGTYFEFKNPSAIGVTAAAVGGTIPTYIGVNTTRRYGYGGDLSGGPARQDVDLDDGRQIFRLSTGPTTWGPWLLEAKPASDFDMQNMLEISGSAKVSLDNMVSWTNRLITMSAGVRNQETSGYHDIYFPPVGTLIPHSGGSNVTVVAATAGQTGLSGGITLNVWESLWYFVPRGSSNASVATNFRIQLYSHPAANTNGVFGTINPTQDAGQWVRIVSRNGDANLSMYTWGTGDKCSAGAQFGNGGMDVQESVARHMSSNRYLANGYLFRPWNLTNTNPTTFGFSGAYIRSISMASNDMYTNASGYKDIPVPAVGTVIYGVGGVVNTAWRATTPNDAMYRMGEAYLGEGPSATTPVMDFAANYQTLWFAHDIDGGTNAGTWYLTIYNNNHTVPPHWIFVAQMQDDGRIGTFTGEKLNRGEFLWAGKREQLLNKSRFTITSSGQFDCRWSGANFFSGTAANGIGTSGGTTAVLVSWVDNAGLMAAMDGDQGRPYTWVNVPSAGYAIPLLDAAGTRTRIVTTIAGRRFVPLSQWESLIYIPQQNGPSSSTVDRGWFVVNYGDSRHIPANAITVATYSSPSAVAGASTNKTRVKIGDGTYIQPGTAIQSVGVPSLNDHAQGTTVDEWRDIVVAGQTGPGMTAPLAAVTGVTGPWSSPYNPQFRLVSNQYSARGSVELRGILALNANITAPSSVIAFLPGAAIMGNPIVTAYATASGLADAQLIPVQIRLASGVVNGSNGVLITAYSNSMDTTANPYFTLAVSGGARAAGTLTWVSFDNITVPHG